MDLIKFVPESKEDALGMLAEFIEDCGMYYHATETIPSNGVSRIYQIGCTHLALAWVCKWRFDFQTR